MFEPAVRISLAEVYIQCDFRLVYVRKVEIDRVEHVTSERDVVHGPYIVAVTGMNRLPPAEAAGGISRRVWEMDGHHSEKGRSSAMQFEYIYLYISYIYMCAILGMSLTRAVLRLVWPSILLQSTRDRVTTAAETVTTSRLWIAMSVKQRK